ncbi:uncharacterized protein RBU47_008671 [Passerculus sandwichensis]
MPLEIFCKAGKMNCYRYFCCDCELHLLSRSWALTGEMKQHGEKSCRRRLCSQEVVHWYYTETPSATGQQTRFITPVPGEERGCRSREGRGAGAVCKWRGWLRKMAGAGAARRGRFRRAAEVRSQRCAGRGSGRGRASGVGTGRQPPSPRTPRSRRCERPRAGQSRRGGPGQAAQAAERGRGAPRPRCRQLWKVGPGARPVPLPPGLCKLLSGFAGPCWLPCPRVGREL